MPRVLAQAVRREHATEVLTLAVRQGKISEREWSPIQLGLSARKPIILGQAISRTAQGRNDASVGMSFPAPAQSGCAITKGGGSIAVPQLLIGHSVIVTKSLIGPKDLRFRSLDQNHIAHSIKDLSIAAL